MPRVLSEPPTHDPFVVPADQTDPRGRLLPRLQLGKKWLQWFGTRTDELEKAPAREAVVNLSAQTASLGTTPFPLGTIPPGIWRVSYVARIATPAGVSSSLEVTVSWIDGGVAQSQTAAAIVGNATTTVQFGTLILRVDDATPISYATTYASDPAAGMVYALDLVCEALALD